MKVFKIQKNNCVYVSMIGLFFIFLTFIGMSFILLMMELDFYNKLKSSIDNTFNKGLAQSYINNKIKAYDGENIEVVSKDGKDMLVLEDKNTNLMTYVYIEDGNLCEKILTSKEEFDEFEGQKLFGLYGMNIKEKDNVYKITLHYSENEKVNSYIYVNSKN